MKKVIILLLCLVNIHLYAQQKNGPGPYFKAINNDSIYQLAQPPSYQPFAVYGMFLAEVAAQQTEMVLNPTMKVPESVVKTANVIFKEIEGEQIGVDIYQPKGDNTPNPLILIIHGGYWKAGDKSVHTQQGIEFAEMGYTAASVNYRLSAKHKFPANVADIYECLQFLKANAETYNIDPTRIVTYGGSAGGHLSAFIGLAANTAGREYNVGIDADAIKGIITLYGMHDLTLPIQKEHPYTIQYIGKTFEEASAVYRDASPVYHVDGEDPPVLLIHGSIDGSVSVKNSDALADMLKYEGVKYTYDRVEGWPHAMDFFSPIYERSLWYTYQFLLKNMPSDEMKKAQK